MKKLTKAQIKKIKNWAFYLLLSGVVPIKHLTKRRQCEIDLFNATDDFADKLLKRITTSYKLDNN